MLSSYSVMILLSECYLKLRIVNFFTGGDTKLCVTAVLDFFPKKLRLNLNSHQLKTKLSSKMFHFVALDQPSDRRKLFFNFYFVLFLIFIVQGKIMQSIFPCILIFTLSLLAKVIFAENTTNPGKFSEIKTCPPLRSQSTGLDFQGPDFI